jgi:hypothetical protein
LASVGTSFSMNGLRKVSDGADGSAFYRVDFAPGGAGVPGTDSGAIAAGFITVSVLSTDANDRRALKALGRVKSVSALPQP